MGTRSSRHLPDVLTQNGNTRPVFANLRVGSRGPVGAAEASPELCLLPSHFPHCTGDPVEPSHIFWIWKEWMMGSETDKDDSQQQWSQEPSNMAASVQVGSIQRAMVRPQGCAHGHCPAWLLLSGTWDLATIALLFFTCFLHLEQLFWATWNPCNIIPLCLSFFCLQPKSWFIRKIKYNF